MNARLVLAAFALFVSFDPGFALAQVQPAECLAMQPDGYCIEWKVIGPEYEDTDEHIYLKWKQSEWEVGVESCQLSIPKEGSIQPTTGGLCGNVLAVAEQCRQSDLESRHIEQCEEWGLRELNAEFGKELVETVTVFVSGLAGLSDFDRKSIAKAILVAVIESAQKKLVAEKLGEDCVNLLSAATAGVTSALRFSILEVLPILGDGVNAFYAAVRGWKVNYCAAAGVEILTTPQLEENCKKVDRAELEFTETLVSTFQKKYASCRPR